jgi:hypothetical protein
MKGENKGTIVDSGPNACWASARPQHNIQYHKCACTEGTAFLTGIQKQVRRRLDDEHARPPDLQYTCCDEDKKPTNASIVPLCSNWHHPEACRANGKYDHDCCAKKAASSCAKGFAKVQSNQDCSRAQTGIVFSYECVPEPQRVEDFTVICKNMSRRGGDRGVDCRPDMDKEVAAEALQHAKELPYILGIVFGVPFLCLLAHLYGKKKKEKERKTKIGGTPEIGVQMAVQPARQPVQPTAPRQATQLMPPRQVLQVQIPHHWTPGQPVIVAVAGGGQMQVMPPPGSLAGQMITVQPPAMQVQAIVPTIMNVTIPANVFTGTMLALQTPDGRTVQVAVPAGMEPGQTFQIQV